MEVEQTPSPLQPASAPVNRIKKKKSVSLNGTPNAHADVGADTHVAHTGSLGEGEERGIRRKKSGIRHPESAKSPSDSGEERGKLHNSSSLRRSSREKKAESSPTSPALSEGGSSVSETTPVEAELAESEEKAKEKEARKLARRLSKSKAEGGSSRTRSPSSEAPDSPRESLDTGRSLPPPITIPTRKRKDSVTKPVSPHPLRNSFTQDDFPPEEPKSGALYLEKKNSLSGIQENEGDAVGIFPMPGNLFLRRQSLPVSRRRALSVDKGDSNPTSFEQANRIRSHSLDLPFLIIPNSFPSLNETREDKLDRLNRLIPTAERFSLTHFLDEAGGDVDIASDMFLQRSLFTMSSDGNIRRSDSTEDIQDPSSPKRRNRLSRLMGGMASNISPTKTLWALFEKDEKDKEEKPKEKRKSILDDEEFMNSDRGIEDLLKLLDREDEILGTQTAPVDPPQATKSPQEDSTSPKKPRGRHISLTFLSKESPSMKRSSSSPFAQEKQERKPEPLKERRIYSSDSLPTAISHRAFQSSDTGFYIPLYPPTQRKHSHGSEGHLTSFMLNGFPPVLENLKKLVNSKSQKVNLTTSEQRKRLFFAIETMSTEFVYVQVLEVLATVFVKPLYQAIVDKKPIISLYEMQAIFSSLIETPKHHLNFLLQLHQRLDSWNEKSVIGDLFVDHIARLNPYKTFACNLPAAKNMVVRCSVTNPAFEEFLEETLKNPLCNGISLRDLLDTPLQRIPRYKMLIKDLLTNTDSSHPDFQKLGLAYNNIKVLNEAISITRSKEESLKRLSLALQTVEDCPPALFSCVRVLVDEIIVGEISSNGTTKKIVKMFLLSDGLVITERTGRSGSGRKVASVNKIANEEMNFRFESFVTHSSLFIMETPEKAPENSFHLWFHEAQAIYQAQNQEQRTKWLENLRSMISKTPLQTETQTQLQRHFSTTSSKSPRMTFSLKKRSVSLSSSPGPSSSLRLSATSFDSLMKSSSSKASLREDRLEDILRDPVGLERFTAFLKMEFSEENVLFWAECENYKALRPDQLTEAGQKIFESYVAHGAPNELNIKYKLHEELIDKVTKGQFDENLFQAAQEDIFALMLTDSYPRFLKSDIYADYCRDRHTPV